MHLSSLTILRQFETTKKLPLAVVAVSIVDSKRIITKSSNGSEVHLYFSKQLKMKQTSFAVQFVPAVIDAMENVLESQIPIDQIDIFQLSSASIETQSIYFGLMGFSSKIAFPDSSAWSENDQEKSAFDITKAIAKQWLGGSLTFSNNSWLEGALIDLISYKVINNLYPSLREPSLDKIKMLRLMEQLELGFASPSQTEKKAYYVLEMMGQHFGMDVIFKSIKELLRLNQFSSVNERVLYTMISQKINIRFETVITPWLDNTAYPLVTVVRSPFLKESLSITQESWTKHEEDITAEENTLPLSTTISYEEMHQKEVQKIFINGTSSTDVTKAKSENGWINANTDLSGLYAVNYDMDNWLLLISQLQSNHKAISALGRANIIHNAFAMTRRNDLDITVSMTTLCYIPKEKEYIAIATAIENLQLLDLFSNHVTVTAVTYFKNILLQPTLKRLGWKQITEYSDRYLQSEALRMALINGNKAIVKEGLSLFNKLIVANAAVAFKYLPARLRQQAYIAGVIHGTQEDFDTILAEFLNMESSDLKTLLAKALCQTKRTEDIRKLLKFTSHCNDQLLRFQMLTTLASNPHGKQATLQYVLDNLQQLETISFQHTEDIIQVLAKGLWQLEDIKKIQQIVKGGTTTNINFKSIMSVMKVNLEFVKRNEGYIVKWLQAYKKGKCEVNEWKSIG